MDEFPLAAISPAPQPASEIPSWAASKGRDLLHSVPLCAPPREALWTRRYSPLNTRTGPNKPEGSSGESAL